MPEAEKKPNDGGTSHYEWVVGDLIRRGMEDLASQIQPLPTGDDMLLLSNRRSQEQTSYPGAFPVPSGIPREFDVEEPTATEEPPQETGDTGTAGTELDTALQAVRVDDIMTVRAEPLADQSRLYKLIAAISFLLVVTIVTLAVTLTRMQSNASTETIQTYDAEARFRLIQKLLLDRMEPFYQVNNATSKDLQHAFQEPNSPQYKALDWMAYQDLELQFIPRPSLDMYEEVSSEPFSDGPELHLTSSPTFSHDRILQRYVLAVLFYSTGSVDWTNSFEFLSDGPECDWSGAILCTNSTSITHLDLGNNDLKGTIPFELSALTHLESLVLANNDLTGTLPPAFVSLTNLQEFDLGSNKKLHGTIPESYYNSWTNLQSWILTDAQVSGTISTHIGNLGQLQTLLWRRNRLGGTLPPQFWSHLTNMEKLDLSQQKIFQGGRFHNQTIGTEIGLWSNLKSMIFHGLELRGTIPTEIGLLTNAVTFQIANNHLHGTIPSEVGAMTSMSRLTMSINPLTGTVPTEVLQMTNLQQLYLQNTMLTGDVSFLCSAIANGTLLPMDPLRVNMREVTGCSCCTCCLY